ncbi:hypothetical protein [Acidocella sp. C78]|uniref:hypothetical protein n=1 Tax=Acidocella sp. C78 TaxID=1671486 RepID=UPI00191BB4DD|nr:hypothetical protein [Acidocella sp. C78]
MSKKVRVLAPECEDVMAEHYNRADGIVATEIFHEYLLKATQEAENRERLGKIRRSR